MSGWRGSEAHGEPVASVHQASAGGGRLCRQAPFRVRRTLFVVAFPGESIRKPPTDFQALSRAPRINNLGNSAPTDFICRSHFGQALHPARAAFGRCGGQGGGLAEAQVQAECGAQIGGVGVWGRPRRRTPAVEPALGLGGLVRHRSPRRVGFVKLGKQCHGWRLALHSEQRGLRVPIHGA